MRFCDQSCNQKKSYHDLYLLQSHPRLTESQQWRIIIRKARLERCTVRCRVTTHLTAAVNVAAVAEKQTMELTDGRTRTLQCILRAQW